MSTFNNRKMIKCNTCDNEFEVGVEAKGAICSHCLLKNIRPPVRKVVDPNAPKGKRGRPKNHSADVAVKAEKDITDNKPKGKRGRPKKSL